MTNSTCQFYETGNRQSDCSLVPAVLVIVGTCALCVCIAMFMCRRKQRGALGGNHPYFASLNGEVNRDSLMRRFMRESQVEALPDDERVRFDSPPVMIGSNRVPNAGSMSELPRASTTRSGAVAALGGLFAGISPSPKNRPRRNTGANIGLIDNDNCREVQVEEDPIGCGAAGNVLPGTWRGKRIAIKEMQTMDGSLSKGEAESLLRSFQREVLVCCEVEHPNLVSFFGYTTKPKLCLYMELVEGGSLSSALYPTHPDAPKWYPTFAQIESVVLDISRGMYYLHSQDPVVIHRDLKSPNLLLVHQPAGPFTRAGDRTGGPELPAPVCKITDFGLSREKPDAKEVNLRMTNVSRVVGTPSWMAPELFDPEQNQRRTLTSIGTHYTEAVDTYAFAIIISELLTSELPWAGLTFPKLRKAVLIDKSRPPIPADTPAKLRDVMEACWRHDSAQRPSFEMVLQALNWNAPENAQSVEVRKQLLGASGLTVSSSGPNPGRFGGKE